MTVPFVFRELTDAMKKFQEQIKERDRLVSQVRQAEKDLSAFYAVLKDVCTHDVRETQIKRVNGGYLDKGYSVEISTCVLCKDVREVGPTRHGGYS